MISEMICIFSIFFLTNLELNDSQVLIARKTRFDEKRQKINEQDNKHVMKCSKVRLHIKHMECRNTYSLLHVAYVA